MMKELPRLGMRLSGYVLVAALLVLWELSANARVVPSTSWPRLSSVISEMVRGTVSGELFWPWLGTLYRLFVGYAAGSAAGLALGLIVGYYATLYRVFNPLVEAIRPVPTPAIIPPLILLLGIDNLLKISIISLAVFFPVFINMVGGVRSVGAVLLDTGRTFRIGMLRTLLHVVLPSAFPAAFAGLRIATSLALVVTVVSEMTAGSSGLGFYIVQMQYVLRPEAMYAAVIYLSLTGYALNLCALRAERRVLAWQGRSA